MNKFNTTSLPLVFEGIVKNMPNSSVLIFDTDLRYVFAEGSELNARKYFSEHMLGKTLFEVLGEERSKYFEPNYQRALNGEKFQLKTTSKGVTYLVSFSNIEIEPGKIEYGLAIIQNITDLVKAEEELADQKKLYEQVIQGISAGVWHWPDVNSDIQWWSDRYYQLLGYRPYEIEASLQNFDVLIHPEDRNAAYSIQRKHLEDESTFYIEYRLKTKNAGYKWFLASGKIAFDTEGKPKSMVGSLIDVDDRKTAEDLLINATLKFRGIFNNATGYMALLDATGKYIECSPSLLTLRRKNIHEIIGSHVWDIGDGEIDIMGSDRLKEFIELANKGQQSKETLYFEGETLGKLYLSITCKPIYDTDRKIAYIIMEAHDITNITDAKNTLAYQKQQLENFAHITSHNLRAPAANIAMLLSLIKNTSEEEERNQVIENISKSSEVLIETINTLAEILRIRQEVNIPLSSIDLQTKFERKTAELSAIISNANATFKTDFSNCPAIAYPKAYIDSIFMNMLTNSIKYAAPNRPPHIIITSGIENDRPFLKFTDNGIGIDLNRHGGKIFGLYKVFTRRKDAHGVGLFLVKNQVESQGGSITVDSELNKGTTFTIHF